MSARGEPGIGLLPPAPPLISMHLIGTRSTQHSTRVQLGITTVGRKRDRSFPPIAVRVTMKFIAVLETRSMRMADIGAIPNGPAAVERVQSAWIQIDSMPVESS